MQAHNLFFGCSPLWVDIYIYLIIYIYTTSYAGHVLIRNGRLNPEFNGSGGPSPSVTTVLLNLFTCIFSFMSRQVFLHQHFTSLVLTYPHVQVCVAFFMRACIPVHLRDAF